MTLTSPQDGFQDIIGCPIAFAATAMDPDGATDRVEFYVNGVVVATDTSAPYEVEDHSDGFPYPLAGDGPHTAFARVYDDGYPQLSADSQDRDVPVERTAAWPARCRSMPAGDPADHPAATAELVGEP